jgi:hypothetical protein
VSLVVVVTHRYRNIWAIWGEGDRKELVGGIVVGLYAVCDHIAALMALPHLRRGEREE